MPLLYGFLCRCPLRKTVRRYIFRMKMLSGRYGKEKKLILNFTVLKTASSAQSAFDIVSQQSDCHSVAATLRNNQVGKAF